MNAFLSAFRLLSKVKAAKHTSRIYRRWCLSSDIPTGKYEKNDQAKEFYKSETQTSDNSDQYRTQHYPNIDCLVLRDTLGYQVFGERGAPLVISPPPHT